MGVFQNSFTQFAVYFEVTFAEDAGIFLPGELEPNITGQESAQPVLVEVTDFDLFTWVANANDGSMDAMATGASPVTPFPELIPLTAADPGGLPADLGGSPADAWLSGNEWSGCLSSGTVDPTGQGNDVISVDGEVLNLP